MGPCGDKACSVLTLRMRFTMGHVFTIEDTGLISAHCLPYQFIYTVLANLHNFSACRTREEVSEEEGMETADAEEEEDADVETADVDVAEDAETVTKTSGSP